MGLRWPVYVEITHHSSPTLDSSLSTKEHQIYELCRDLLPFASMKTSFSFLIKGHKQTKDGEFEIKLVE